MSMFPVKNLLRSAFPSNSILRASTIEAAVRRSRLYVIFLTPRSGSTWLTELIMNTGGLGAPQEWFNDGWIYTNEPALGCLPPRLRGTTDINSYFESIVTEGRGVAGLELSLYQAVMLAELLDTSFKPDWLAVSFYLRRRDLAAQAISLYRSIATERFHSYQNRPEQVQAFRDAQYDYSSIRKWFDYLVANERYFKVMFRSSGVSPIGIYYEDLHINPLETLRQIARNVGVALPQTLPATSLRIMRDEISDDWRQRFVTTLFAECPNMQDKLAARAEQR